MLKHISIFAVAATMAVTASAINRAELVRYASALSGLKKAELKAAVARLSQPQTVLGYGSGTGKTWDGFYQTDRVAATGECVNRYSTRRFYFSSTNTAQAVAGMNIEHSMPKSWWGGTVNNAYRDLYNLYPSDTDANSDKGNYAMGRVTAATISDGYERVGTGDAGGTTIRLCEPNDEWKGDFCRSYFYMATTYYDLPWQGNGSATSGGGLQTMEPGAWPTLKQWAQTLYLEWTRADKVSQTETERNEAVAAIQGNRNLYIDFPTLAEYVWGDSTAVAFNPATALTTATDDTRYATYTPPTGGGSGPNTGGDDNTPGTGTTVPGTSLFFEPFDDVTTGNNTSNSGSSSAWSGNDNIVSATSAWQAGGAIRLGSSKAKGTLVSRQIAFEGGTLCVSLDVKGWAAVEGKLEVTLTGSATQTVEYTATMSAPFEQHTLTFSGVAANPTLTIATTAKRCFVDNLRVFTPTADAVRTPLAAPRSSACFTLGGQRVTVPSNHGVYIVGGKKVVRR